MRSLPLTSVALGLAGAAALNLPSPAGAAATPSATDPRKARVAHSVTPATAEAVDLRRFRARHRTVRLAERVERRTDLDLPTGYRARLLDETPTELAERREGLRERLAPEPDEAAPASPALRAIAACESGGDYAADTGNGFYGAYQFDQATWASVGGSGSPAAASPAEQDARAAQLYARAGASPWPVCGR